MVLFWNRLVRGVGVVVAILVSRRSALHFTPVGTDRPPGRTATPLLTAEIESLLDSDEVAWYS
jgi:hypothetical protein